MKYYDLMEKVLSNPDLKIEEKTKLLDELRKNNPYDRWTSRVAIWILGAAALATIVCITIIIRKDGDAAVPDGLIAIGSAAVGGLAGLLSQKQPTTNDQLTL